MPCLCFLDIAPCLSRLIFMNAAERKATKSAIAKLTAEINALWTAHKPGQPTAQIDTKTSRLRNLRASLEPTFIPGPKWCTSDGQWWI